MTATPPSRPGSVAVGLDRERFGQVVAAFGALPGDRPRPARSLSWVGRPTNVLVRRRQVA